MAEQISTVTIDSVTSKEGTSASGKPWRKWSVKDGSGTFYSTFDAALGAAAHALEGKAAEIHWKPSGDQGQFRDVVAIKAAEGNPISNSTPEGNTDWDLIGLRKTRCLLWAHYIGSPLAQAQDGADAAYRLGSRLIALAESDIFTRPPAGVEEDIPF